MKWLCLACSVALTLILGAIQAPPLAAQSSVLPAPLLLIDETGLIIRIETDGVTRRQIVLDSLPINFFDVSPTNGAIAYVVGNNLVLVDANGQNPVVLFEGGTIERDDFGTPTLNAIMTNQITHPAWSPDGTKIAFGYGGVNVLDVATRERRVLLPTGAPNESATPDMPLGAKIYHTQVWSPDSTTLLISFGEVPQGNGSVILDLATGNLSKLLNAGFTFCCGTLAFNNDGSAVYISSATFYRGEAGLWSFNVASKTLTDLGAVIYPAPKENALVEFTGADLLADGYLYFFVDVVDLDALAADPTLIFDKTMMRARPDGSGLEALRPNDPATYPVYDVLWSPTGSGAVVSLGGINYPPYIDNSTNLFYNAIGRLPAGGGELLGLGFGTNLRWVK